MASNSDRIGIISTHGYMYDNNKRSREGDDWDNISNYGRPNNGRTMWENYFHSVKNLSLVVSGHVLRPSPGAVGRLMSVGDFGNVVNQQLANYQANTNYGDGLVRILTFKTTGKVEVRTYSTWSGYYLTDSDNQFVFDLTLPSAGGLAQARRPASLGGVNSRGESFDTLTWNRTQFGVDALSQGLIFGMPVTDGAGVWDVSTNFQTPTFSGATAAGNTAYQNMADAGVYLTNGVNDRAVYLSGTNVVVYRNQSVFSGLSNITVSCLFKRTAPFTQRGFLVSAFGGCFYLNCNNVNTIAFTTVNASGTRVDFITANTGFNFTDGNWHHVVAVYDGVSMKVWVNGIFMGSMAQTGALGSATGNLTVGNYNGLADNLGTTWQGAIDDCYVWNRALSTNEVLRLYELETGNKVNLSVNGTVSAGFATMTNGFLSLSNGSVQGSLTVSSNLTVSKMSSLLGGASVGTNNYAGSKPMLNVIKGTATCPDGVVVQAGSFALITTTPPNGYNFSPDSYFILRSDSLANAGVMIISSEIYNSGTNFAILVANSSGVARTVTNNWNYDFVSFGF